MLQALALFPILGLMSLTAGSEDQFPFQQLRMRKLEAYSEASRQRPEYAELESTFRQTLKDWQSQGVRTVQALQEHPWELSTLFLLNEAGDRALLFVHEDRGDFQNWIMFAAEATEKDSWQFYSSGLPSFGYQDYTEAEAFTKAKTKLIQDGLVSWRGKVKDDYISERWFTEDRHRLHEQFLNDKIDSPQ